MCICTYGYTDGRPRVIPGPHLFPGLAYSRPIQPYSRPHLIPGPHLVPAPGPGGPGNK